MSVMINLADRGILPDQLIRMGIRHLDRRRLQGERHGNSGPKKRAKDELIVQMIHSPIAVQTQKANQQHYELPAAFFETVLGEHLKYSGSYWPDGCDSLSIAESAMLDLYCERAELSDGIQILELGCGWGSLCLRMAAKYPQSRIIAVSNSNSQREFISNRCHHRGIRNLKVITADMNTFDVDQRFDRVVSIEMFEHMRNWQRLLEKISRWLKEDGKLFVHIFSHKTFAYPFETDGAGNWMGRHFFSGGMMPSHDLIQHFNADLMVEKDWQIDGRHYQKTAEAWLQNLDSHRDSILQIFGEVYGTNRADIWLQRWRIFFMACAELWGYREGREWQISHYRLRQNIRSAHPGGTS